jgi:hypothetical protein
VAGNPAKILRRIETKMDPSQKAPSDHDQKVGAEEPMSQQAAT